MTQPRSSARSTGSRRTAGVGSDGNSTFKLGLGSVGGGTGLAYWGQDLGPNSGLGHLLIYIAPTVSVLLASGLLYVRALIRINRLRRSLPRALETFAKAIDDPNTPEEAKAEYQKKVAEVHRIQADAELSHLHFIGRFWQ